MKKVVLFGGGTGLTSILRSLKNEDLDLTVVVTTSDNGGSTGKIREMYKMPAPGDLRRAVVALSTLPDIEELINYRFDDRLDNHTIGNLILTAFNEMSDDFATAVEKYKILLDVQAKIYPVTNESLEINAIMKDGSQIVGETQMVNSDQQIEYVYYKRNVKALQQVVDELLVADYIILSCGSLYSSILSNIVYDNILELYPSLKAKTIYVCNLMTEVGETEGYNVSDHVNAIEKHLHTGIDYMLVNNNYNVPFNIYQNYLRENSSLVLLDESKVSKNVNIIANDYVIISEGNHIRHNTELICKDIMKIIGGDYGKDSSV
ncbi:uridine diphosphate-N-acetylglucosamine-binding protein YvcK [Mollicutes bacterium LVI A0078]|nr:uridine diphosphate-N-acetylglucosamine-binding protein YvcK [Mollicutes bacterium LVI A0075]WOO91152.1 uridine diphosphate-N-acetylglucosamine-binding protein YvcK [Mollicutes bacterium LVI A0078]